MGWFRREARGLKEIRKAFEDIIEVTNAEFIKLEEHG